MINLFLITFLACGDDEETDTSKLEVESPQEEAVEESTEEVEGEEQNSRAELNEEQRFWEASLH